MLKLGNDGHIELYLDFGRIPRSFARAVTDLFEKSFDCFKSFTIIFTKSQKKIKSNYLFVKKIKDNPINNKLFNVVELVFVLKLLLCYNLEA